MIFPKTLDALMAAGYCYENTFACKECDEVIEWWSTPEDEMVAINPMYRGIAEAIPHEGTCTGKKARP